jgi:hypothetical protein
MPKLAAGMGIVGSQEVLFVASCDAATAAPVILSGLQGARGAGCREPAHEGAPQAGDPPE